jgi:FrmR/RcnR family transcriptional regulator, repressor of frmRAB operon
MAHTTKDKEKLLNRVSRIKGQINAIEKALDGNEDCSKVLQTIAACRGAINGLMAEVLEGHVRFHVAKLPAPPTVGGASGTAVTGRGSMWRTRMRGSLPSGRHLTTSGALRTLQQKSRTSLVWRFESTIQRAGCGARKSGSVGFSTPAENKQPIRAKRLRNSSIWLTGT